VSGADRTRRHPTSQLPGHRIPTCATILGPLHQVSSSCHGPCRCTPCRTCHLHTTRQANANKTKVKEKQNETILDSNSNLAKSTTHHNQTKEHTTWFLNLLLDESIDNKSTKFKVRIQDPMKHNWKTKKGKKSSRRSSRRKKTTKANKRQEKWQSQAKWQGGVKKN
jgi:hypothetical protein